MTPEATALAQSLLEHHRGVCWPRRGTNPSIDSCLVTYSMLCDRAGVPHLVRPVGTFLREVAEWCEANDWPPITPWP
jgi:hypothetical protein